MGVILPEATPDNQSATSLGLDPLLSESSPPFSTWATIDPIKAALLEAEIKMDLGEESLHDYLLDQDVESVTLWDTSRPPVSNRALYKHMPKFGTSDTDQSRPILLVVGTTMDYDEAEPSWIDFPSSQAPRQPEGCLPVKCTTPTVPSEPAVNPLDLQLSAREEQVILGGGPADEDEEKALAPPQVLANCQQWTTRDTHLQID